MRAWTSSRPTDPSKRGETFSFTSSLSRWGLLIALALEGIVGYIHERHLVHEANANITSEMRDNQKDVEDSVKAAVQYQKDMKQLIALMEADESRQGIEGFGQHHF